MNKKMVDKLIQRDGRLCGIHLGGCGRKIAHRSEMSVDHIIPKRVPLSLYADYPVTFEGYWNLQVMHVDCNNRKGSEVSKILDLACKCHYYEIRGDDLYMVYLGERRTESHLCVPGIVGHERRFRHGSFSGINIENGGGYYRWHTKEDQPEEKGIYLPLIGSEYVERFNIHQRKRVGLDVPDRIIVDHITGHVRPEDGWVNRYPWQA